MGILSLAPLCISGLRLEGETLFLEAEGEDAVAPCPSCGVASCRVQARYRRFPLDLPWRGFVVRLAVRARRFRCDNEACARRTFAEEFGAILGWRRRFTSVVQAILADVAAALGGRAGARLAERQGAPASRDTLLRLLRAEPAEPASTPRVLGVDDLALRRGRRYATLLMNAVVDALDLDALVDCFAPDAAFFDPPGQPPLVGREAIGQRMARSMGAIQQAHTTVAQVFISGDSAAYAYQSRLTAKNGRSATIEGIDAFEFNDQGRIQVARFYWDPTPLRAILQG